jgi:hypothetical protein
LLGVEGTRSGKDDRYEENLATVRSVGPVWLPALSRDEPKAANSIFLQLSPFLE